MSAGGRTGWRRGLGLGLLQAGLLLSLGGQLLLDRALRPRGWIRAEPVDPFLPIRGRYVNLTLLVPAPAGADGRPGAPVVLRSEAGQVRAALAGPGTPRSRNLQAYPRTPQAPGVRTQPMTRIGGGPGPFRIAGARPEPPDPLWRLEPSVAFFIPPDVADPSRRPAGEQLWVDVTLPEEGPPRPIRLGVKRGNGPITPLALR